MRATPLALLALAPLLVACGERSGSSTGDCTTQVRFEGRTYEEIGFSSRHAEKSSHQGLQAGCTDRDPGRAGATFDHGAFRTDVWTFEGHPDVIALQMDDDGYRVLVPLDPSEAFLLEIHRSGLLDPGDD